MSATSQLKKIYITFGFKHQHYINGQFLDKDAVAVFECKDAEAGRAMAFDHFGQSFAFAYFDEEWTPAEIEYYSRGYVELLHEEKEKEGEL